MNNHTEYPQNLKDLFVVRPATQSIWNVMDEARNRAKLEDEPRCILITGSSGVGKSHTLKEYVKRNPVRSEDDHDVRPVIYLEIPSNRSLKTLARDLLKELQFPKAETIRADRDSLFQLAVRQMTLEGVELIILDEFQQLGEKGINQSLRTAADVFKSLAKKECTPLAMAGLPSAKNVLASNEQLDRLCIYREEIRHFTRDKVGSKEFVDFLADLEGQLPFGKIGLAHKSLATKIFRAASGHVSFTMTLIREAAFLAMKSDESLNEKLLAKAFNNVLSGVFRGAVNPFA